MAPGRRAVLFNNGTTTIHIDGDISLVQEFHSQLPSYARTPLHHLDGLAEQLGVKSVFVKDESKRLNLPAFKILGASRGSCRAIISKLCLPEDSSLNYIARAAREHAIVLFSASEGNHGRALAAMAKILGISAHIYVPHTVDAEAARLIASEGAKVTISQSDYDGAVAEAYAKSKTTKGGLLVQDNSFEGYSEIPRWIVEGYSTLLFEVEQQLAEIGLEHGLVVSPVGVGSLAHAVVRHCKSNNRHCAVMTVEPDTAPCLYKSLECGRPSSIRTSETIMDGLNCGTLSPDAFQDLQAGVDASVTVSDFEAHQAVQYLAKRGIESGPCGAATLAALWRLAEASRRPDWLTQDTVIVILNTEGARNYDTPQDVSIDDPVELTQQLTTINSSNPDLSNTAGAGETAVASYISAWLQHRDIETHWLEATPGRPSVVGVLRGKGGGKSIMLNGHIDTVSLSSYSPNADPLSGELTSEDGGRIYGRGCLDMKAGVAAAMSVMAKLASSPSQLCGDLILAAVADEENFSKGTEEVLAAGWKADAAIIPEPTMQDIVTSHKGFVWVEIDVLGVAAHGSLPEQGVDAILLTGLLQTALLEYAKTMPSDPILGQASLHGGRIVGGEEPSSYPELCTLTIEFRTIPSQTPDSVLHDLERLLSRVARDNSAFQFRPPRVVFSRPPTALENTHHFVQSFISATIQTLGSAPSPTGRAFWCDAGLLSQAGTPTIIYGPKGDGLHAKEEWVSVQSIREVASVLQSVVQNFSS